MEIVWRNPKVAHFPVSTLEVGKGDDLKSITERAYNQAAKFGIATKKARKNIAAVLYLAWLAADEERDLSRFARHVLISTGIPGGRTKLERNTKWERDMSDMMAAHGEGLEVGCFMDDMGNYDLRFLHYFLEQELGITPEWEDEYEEGDLAS